MRDAQALQYILATVSGASLVQIKSAFKAYKKLAIDYGDQKLAEIIRLENRQRRLILDRGTTP